MNNIIKEMMSSGMALEEAKAEYAELRSDFMSCIEVGDYYGAEDVMCGYGIDLDYIFDLI